jgi:hypothetical protein
MRPRFRQPGFKQELYTPEEGVNIDSPAWDAIPLEIFSERNGLPRSNRHYVRAAASFKLLHRNFARASGGAPMSEEGVNLTRADVDLNLLREAILREMNNWSDDRVLMASQNAMRSVSGMSPGIWSSDERARSVLEGVQKELERAFSTLQIRRPRIQPGAWAGIRRIKCSTGSRERSDVLSDPCWRRPARSVLPTTRISNLFGPAARLRPAG